MIGTFWALVPPIVAIVLALITKEAYSSLFIGIVVGALFYTGFSPIGTLDTVLNDGFLAAMADAWNAGIFLFLVLLGTMVALVNAAGGSAAFGRWATTHVKTRGGAMIATFVLGILIFIDDYFNCLTV
ncbi:MAG: Na+/H+ antiporter NhaC family protein, partial [Oscillospiraceae bacterium]|nr:Na+/H+ antiporter NhaC family protein [Oscillospiraceae bacterium]